ncbi:MAG: class I SAM-dependent methyltransferase [Actinomycetota bacterium]
MTTSASPRREHAATSGRWSDYGAMARHVRPAAQRLVDAVGRAPADEPASLLDVGSGTGAALELIAEAGWQPVGLDRSITQLTAHGASAHPLTLADGQCIPIRSGRLGAAISNFALIFADDPRKVLLELHRCLAPDTPIAWSAWCPGGWPEAWRPILAAAVGSEPAPFPVLFGVEATARAVMADVGFGDVRIERHAVSWRGRDAADLVDTITSAAGGLRGARAKLTEAGRWSAVASTLTDEADKRGRPADGGGMAIDDAYLMITGHRR